MSNISFIQCFFFIFFLSENCINAEENSKESQNHMAMFVFGDSLYDPGNNNYLNISITHKANHWPYGVTFFHYPTGRFCDGRVIPDMIATNAKLPIWKPYLGEGVSQNLTKGANFAAGGAGTLPGTDPGTINLAQQLSFFKEVAFELRQQLGEEEADKLLKEAIYLNSIGGNDYVNVILDYPNITESEKIYFVNMVIDILINVTKEIYEIGGRKFAFQNIGPVGCLPFTKQNYGLQGDECAEELQAIIKLHNGVLLKAVADLENHLQGFKYLVFDYFTPLYDIIKNPSQYGFKVADVGCCGNDNCGIESHELCNNPNEYVFFDGGHPGEHTNLILSQLLWNGDSTVTAPYNLKQLIQLQITSHFSLRNFVGNATDHVM